MPDDFPKQTMSKQCQLISAGQNELCTFYLVFGNYLHGDQGRKLSICTVVSATCFGSWSVWVWGLIQAPSCLRRTYWFPCTCYPSQPPQETGLSLLLILIPSDPPATPEGRFPASGLGVRTVPDTSSLHVTFLLPRAVQASFT